MKHLKFKQLILVLFLVNISLSCSQDKFGGLALYTVRDQMDQDTKGTLQAVTDSGYTYIEAAGYKEGKFYNYSPTDFKALLSSLNLTPLSSHNSSVSLENADAMMADVKAAGFQYFVVPVPPMGLFTSDDQGMSMEGGAENLANILNILKIKKPKAFFLENVRHLKNHDEKSERHVKHLNEHINWQKVRSKTVLELAQKNNMIIINNNIVSLTKKGNIFTSKAIDYIVTNEDAQIEDMKDDFFLFRG